MATSAQRDNSFCRTTLYSSESRALYICLSEEYHSCPYYLSFGFSIRFCYHADREALADSGAL
jgi:hypothetical protein